MPPTPKYRIRKYNNIIYKYINKINIFKYETYTNGDMGYNMSKQTREILEYTRFFE